MLASSLTELNSRTEWFTDPAREVNDNTGPFAVVVDNFYSDPNAIREKALSQKFVRYAPPTADQVGEELASQMKNETGSWFTTALFIVRGKPVRHPHDGFTHRTPEVREHLARVVGEKILPQYWDKLGDGWNGAFQLVEEDWTVNHGSIHHHLKPRDLEGRGWSGVVYLSPDAPPSAGTSIWREKRSGRCVASYGVLFDADRNNFELAFQVENRFNRLVLFRENVLHRAEHGFGHGNDARLTQTFFFRSER